MPSSSNNFFCRCEHMLVVSMALGVASCSDSSDNSAPVVDDKEWKVDANKDTSVRPGDDFFRS